VSIYIVKYKIKTATPRDIYCHIKECDNYFTPPLSARLSLQDYARKIFENSVTFEAWSGDILVGLVAAYFNDSDNITGYITNVSILNNYMRQGIAGELMKECIEYAIKNKFNEIKLEVSTANASAIDLYRKFGFVNFGIKDNFLQMKVTGLKRSINSMCQIT